MSMTRFIKYLAFALVMVLLISFTACTVNHDNKETGGQDNVSGHMDLSNNENSSGAGGNAGGEGSEPTGRAEGNGSGLTGIPSDGENKSGNKTADTGNPKSTDENSEPDGIIKITREEAGLETIPSLDFSKFKLNPSIQRLLEDPPSYSDEDYRNGLVYRDFLIISERFGGSIIQNIGIGDGISNVMEILGEPSCIIGNTMFYKTEGYYLGFKGEKEVEQAIISQRPGKYPADILKTLIISINRSDFNGISELIQSNDEISDFFDYNGHIHGGGWYAVSDNGIFIEEFTEKAIVVYNNFEGELFRIQEDLHNYGIVYENIDYLMDRMVSELDYYIWLNEKFDKEGIVSPGGKYNSLYIWNYSESYYFIIRAMDTGKTDLYISLPAIGDYYWLNDRYILYSDFFSFAPVIVDVETCETINLLETAELIDEEPGLRPFEIKSCKDGQIIIYNPDKDKEYLISYSFDPDGRVLLNR